MFDEEIEMPKIQEQKQNEDPFLAEQDNLNRDVCASFQDQFNDSPSQDT
jgi:hypothetical protein